MRYKCGVNEELGAYRYIMPCIRKSDKMDKISVLRQYFGHDSFRDGQERVIDAILSGRDCLGVMPTGAGKSICYQVPAMLFGGVTVVVSPLISLMKDQVNSLMQSGIRAAYLNSSLTNEQYLRAIELAAKGVFKLIYCAPERLLTPSFVSFARRADISMVTVDEAHCVSQWGQDFRPSYMKIAQFVSQLKRRPVVSAFTATATDRVRQDIINMLGLRSPELVTTGFDRKNLYFGVERGGNKYARLCEIVSKNKDKSGIIYTTSRKSVEEVCARLNEDGFLATRYHAGLDDEERRNNQDDFIFDRRPIMVATNAFGMGIDKANVSYVVHYNMPRDIESYYQEAGRCGRDGEPGSCVILYSPQDVRTGRFMIEHDDENDTLPEEQRRRVIQGQLERLEQMRRYCVTTDCLRATILKYFGENAPNRCGCGSDRGCSNCTGEFEEVDITTDSQKILSCVYRLHERRLSFGENVVAAILRGTNDPKIKTHGLETLSTYGIMSDSTAVHIKRVIRFLEDEGSVVRNEYGSLVLTSRARKILIEKRPVTMKVKKQEPKRSTKKERAASSPAQTSARPDLFWKLRALRNQKAMEENMPAYIIFSDASLRDMCSRLPTDRESFLSVSGVGETKCRKYYKEFTSEIKKYISEKGDKE